jgi:SSS family solute:Na+ symporter
MTNPIDWAVVLIPVVVVIWIAIKTQRYMKGVTDFLAAGRAAGRYLVCNAANEASWGAISVVAVFEMYYAAGFAVGWWTSIAAPVGLLMTLTGFVVYRYRETRVLTLAQFFERRYSKKFRIFMGIMAWLSGIINYGIFPAVGARFFVYYCGWPQHFQIAGATIPTFAAVMAVALGSALIFTLMGGQLTAMVTDCIEGLISGVMFVIVAFALLYMFDWSVISATLLDVPEGKSLVNPFKTSEVKDFNIWFVLIGIFGSVYSTMAWQGNQGFNASAESPHEAKMGRILGHWRGYARIVMIMLLAICAYTYMHNPQYAAGAAEVNQSLSQIENETIKTQMTVPVALSHFLPIGVKGMFASIMLFALLACDSSYMHSWGSIFVQDVILPFRKTPLTTAQHLRMLRLSIIGVAIFAFCFSLFFNQTTYILLFFALTGTIYLGGSGAAILGGLYWKRGKTGGAWAGMIVGSGLGVSGIIIDQIWASHLAPMLIKWFPDNQYLADHSREFFINGQWMYFIAMASACVVYMVFSLMSREPDADMDQLLHRGKWAVEEKAAGSLESPRRSRPTWRTLLGFDDQFTFSDKALSMSVFLWSMFWFVIFVIFTAWNFIWPWPDQWWSHYWYVTGILLPLIIGVVTTVWFTWGGLTDLRRLFRALESTHRDATDDGTVQHNVHERVKEEDSVFRD